MSWLLIRAEFAIQLIDQGNHVIKHGITLFGFTSEIITSE